VEVDITQQVALEQQTKDTLVEAVALPLEIFVAAAVAVLEPLVLLEHQVRVETEALV
jgi:hypothetical protein